MRRMTGWLTLVLAFAAGLGCTTASTVTVRLDRDQLGGGIDRLDLGSVDLVEDGMRYENVATLLSEGRFDAEDLAVLSKSLRDSIRANQRGEARGERFSVHVLVRRHYSVVTNNSFTAFACVAWALADPRGEVAYEEQLYATAHGACFPTGWSGCFRSLGWAKTAINKGVVRRIVEAADGFLSAGNEVSVPDRLPDHVYLDFDRAAETVPHELASFGQPVSAEVGVSTSGHVYGGSAVGTGWVKTSLEAGWGWVKEPESVDWDARLASP